VRGDAGDRPREGQRPGLRDRDAEGGRLGDERGVEARVALQRGERAQPAVLLGRHGLHDDPGCLAGRAAGDRRRGVQRGDHPALHVRRPAPVQLRADDVAAVGRARPRLLAGADDVDVAVEADAPRALAAGGDDRLGRDELGARGLLAGMVGMRAQRGQVVLDHRGLQAPSLGEVGEQLRRRALTPGDAGHAHELGQIVGDRLRIDGSQGGFEGHAANLEVPDTFRLWR
jgi:hypothetical protein